MPDTFSPLDVLADELGATAARIERELRLTVSATLAEVRQAQAELRAALAEARIDMDAAMRERLAALKDGHPGPQGERGERGEAGESIVGPAGEQGIPGPPGERGEPGPEPYVGEVCGLYEPAREYRKFDLVTWHGSEWRARCDNPGALPSEGWALAGQAGSRGKPGERGERGMPGPPGATIVSWEMRDFRIVPVMSDGSVGPALDLREFFATYDAERAA